MSFSYPNEKKLKNNKRSNIETVIPLAKSNISLLKPLQIKNLILVKEFITCET